MTSVWVLCCVVWCVGAPFVAVAHSPRLIGKSLFQAQQPANRRAARLWMPSPKPTPTSQKQSDVTIRYYDVMERHHRCLHCADLWHPGAVRTTVVWRRGAAAAKKKGLPRTAAGSNGGLGVPLNRAGVCGARCAMWRRVRRMVEALKSHTRTHACYHQARAGREDVDVGAELSTRARSVYAAYSCSVSDAQHRSSGSTSPTTQSKAKAALSLHRVPTLSHGTRMGVWARLLGAHVDEGEALGATIDKFSIDNTKGKPRWRACLCLCVCV